MVVISNTLLFNTVSNAGLFNVISNTLLLLLQKCALYGDPFERFNS